MQHGHSSPSGDGFRAIPAPAQPIYRVARGLDPFAPPPWQFAGEDGTFGGRFDDPAARYGIPEAQRFRALYCASNREAAFAEVLAHFRPSLALLARLTEIEDHESSGAISQRVTIPADWRSARRVGATLLDPSLRFVDLADPENVQLLRRALAPLALQFNQPDVDLSVLTGPQRMVTQHAARLIYRQVDGTGRPLFAGMRYISRHNAVWDCWAVFEQRLIHTPGVPESILPDDPGLAVIAQLFNFAVEILPGGYVKPGS